MQASGSQSTDGFISNDELWRMYAERPSDFWDNRVDKRNPTAPDFKHKTSGKGLWLNTAPSFVLDTLGDDGGAAY